VPLDHTTPGDAIEYRDSVTPQQGMSKYETGVLLGSGGMADVYRAVDPVLGRAVALKFLRRDDPILVERLLREARAQAKVEHELVCKVYEVGTLGDRAYIAMQLIDGERLDAVAPKLCLEEKLTIVRDVAGAVHAAHRVGLVHRDLKPGNILVESRDGAWRPYVTDFGLVRDASQTALTETGEALGTPSYMAPEQARGTARLVDRRTDVYSLGAVLYELLVGRPPFVGTSPVQILVDVLHDPVTPVRKLVPGVPRALETIAMKCLAKDPDRRYDSARALADDLQRYLDGEPIVARPPGVVARAAAVARRNPLAVAGFVAAAIAGTAGIVAWRASRERAARDVEAARQFGREVERIESDLRHELLLPLHDIRPARVEIRRRMAAIDARLDELGDDARAAGLAAIGRGHYMLREFVDARRRLDEAVALGDREPATIYALGRTYGALFEAARLDARWMTDKAKRDAKLREAEGTLREPALAYLRTSGLAVSPIYGDGLIAYYEGRDADAVARAQQAFAGVPAFYEAKQLEGDALAQEALTAQQAGNYADARAASDRAAAAYATALDIARSDPAVLAAECTRWSYRAEIEGWTDAPSTVLAETYAKGIAACERARVADPDGRAVLEQLSNIYGYRGEYQTYHGEDPTPALEHAASLGDLAVQLAPDVASGYAIRGLAQIRLALYQDGHGIDPVPMLHAAIASYDRAVAIRGSPSAFNSLGVAWKLVAARQADPDPFLDKGVDAYRRSVELDPSYYYAYSNLASLEIRRAEIALARGRDPEAFVASAVANLDRALAHNPKFEFALDARGVADWLRARDDLARGRDPGPALSRAFASWDRAAAADPSYGDSHRNAGGAYVRQAEVALERGDEPSELLAKARAELAIAAAKNKTDGPTMWWSAEAERVEALRAIKHGTSPRAALDAAAAWLAKAEAANARDASVFEAKARLAIVDGRPAEIAAGLAAVDRMVAIEPFRAEAGALRGELLLRSANGRRELAEQARAAFAAAFDANPLLARRYAASAERAAALAK
jgi:serine/threonine-protein kinase